MAPDKLQKRLNVESMEHPEDGATARSRAEAGRNMLRNSVFPRCGADRRPPDLADAKLQAFVDFAGDVAERGERDAAAMLLTKTRNGDGPRAVAAREFAATFYEAAGGNVDLMVRNGGGMIYLLAGCLAGKSANEMFAAPLIAMLGPQVKEFVSVLAGVETGAPTISSRKSREKS